MDEQKEKQVFMAEPNTTPDQIVKLRYCDIPSEATAGILLIDDNQELSVKDKALRTLKIERRDGDSHLKAWIRAMCIENGFEYTEPAPREITDSILNNAAASRFMFVIA